MSTFSSEDMSLRYVSIKVSTNLVIGIGVDNEIWASTGREIS